MKSQNTDTPCNKRRVEEDDGSADCEPHPIKIANVSLSSNAIPLSCAIALKGERDELQDAHFCMDNFKDNFDFISSPTEVVNSSFYCLCDGHAGHRAAVFVTQNLHTKLVELIQKKLSATSSAKPSLADVQSDIKRATIESYKQIDEEFLKKSSESKPQWKDGTTVTNVLLLNKYLYVANVGDARAVLFRQKKTDAKTGLFNEFQVIPLTRDHSAADFEERQRIQKAGGAVKDGRVLGILEVSRSIGDGPYKSYGVTCVPDVKRLQLTADDHFLILACDGLWKVVDPTEVANILAENCQGNFGEAVRSVSQKLTSLALRKLSGDNVTVITVDLRPITTTTTS